MPILLQVDTVMTNTAAKAEELARPEFWDKVLKFVQVYGIKLIIALLIFFIGKWIAGLIAGGIRKMMVHRKSDVTIASFVSNILYALMLLIVVLTALSVLGVKTSSFMVIVSAAVLAIGMSMQGTLSQFASGVMLIGLRPFKIGDSVIAGGQAGTGAVEAGIRAQPGPRSGPRPEPEGGAVGGAHAQTRTRRAGCQGQLPDAETDERSGGCDLGRHRGSPDPRRARDPARIWPVFHLAPAAADPRLWGSVARGRWRPDPVQCLGSAAPPLQSRSDP